MLAMSIFRAAGSKTAKMQDFMIGPALADRDDDVDDQVFARELKARVGRGAKLKT